MCLDSVKAREVFRETMFEGHKVTPVHHFQAAGYKALLKWQSFCSVKYYENYHKRDVTRFFCVDCQRCVCQVFITTDHKIHDIVPLEKAADDKKAKIIARAVLLKGKKEACRGVIRKFRIRKLSWK